MDELNAILRQIVLEPEEDLHRLVYADRLEERGQDWDAAHAKFIRGAVQHKGRGFECYSHPRLYDVGFPAEPEVLNSPFVEFDRGFVAEWIVDAATFLKHADELLWHPTQTMCKECRGTGVKGFGGSCKKYPAGCDRCWFPRPCPPTAQPIRKVVLTTIPELGINWVTTSRVGNVWHLAKWPGVEFVLPVANDLLGSSDEHLSYP